MPSFWVISTSAALTSSACARLSSAQGPAISTSGRSLPRVMSRIETWRGCMIGPPPPIRRPSCHCEEQRDEAIPTRLLRCARNDNEYLYQPRLVHRSLDEGR